MLICLCLMQTDMVTSMMTVLDTDQDGTLDFKDYCRMVSSLSILFEELD